MYLIDYVVPDITHGKSYLLSADVLNWLCCTTDITLIKFWWHNIRKCKSATIVFHKHWIHVVVWPHFRVQKVLFENLVHVRIVPEYLTTKLIAT